jgi:hypothetical protein
MSGRSFRSLFMVASCAGAALSCYLVSLRVASERASLEDVETKIVLAQRDLRVLQTEIGTRGRLAQLERWNASVLAMSAPQADQFLRGSFELAKLTQPQHQVDFRAPIVLASAPAPEPQKAPLGVAEMDDAGAPAATPPTVLIHEASLKTETLNSKTLKTETREVPEKPAAATPLTAGPQLRDKSTKKPVTTAKPASIKAVDKPGLAAAQHGKIVDKPTVALAKPVTKPARIAKVDPLAPLPERHSSKISPSKTSKDLHTGR